MVTAAQAEKHITESLARLLTSTGFTSVSPYMIERIQPGGVAWQLRCGARIDSVSTRPLVTLSVGIRIDAIEQFLDREQEPRAPTLSVPIHFLHKDHRLLEWDANDPDTIGALVEEVRKYGLPFFERYEQLDCLLSSLESDDPQRRVSVSRNERVELLIGVLAVIGRREDAITVADREIEALRSKPPGHRRQLERLRTKLRAEAK